MSKWMEVLISVLIELVAISAISLALIFMLSYPVVFVIALVIMCIFTFGGVAYLIWAMFFE